MTENPPTTASELHQSGSNAAWMSGPQRAVAVGSVGRARVSDFQIGAHRGSGEQPGERDRECANPPLMAAGTMPCGP